VLIPPITACKFNPQTAAPVKCSGGFGCAAETIDNLPIFACYNNAICQGLALTCVDASTNMCTTQHLLLGIRHDDFELVRLLSPHHTLHLGNSTYLLTSPTSSPTACVTYVVQPTGTQIDAFTSWACRDALATTTILQTANKGAATNPTNTRSAPTGISNPGGTGSSNNGNSGDATNPGPGQAASGGPSSTIINAGIIAGIIVGVILVLALTGWVIWRYRRRRRENEEKVRRHGGFTNDFELREPGGKSEAFMGSTQTARWVWNQGTDDKMSVAG